MSDEIFKSSDMLKSMGGAATSVYLVGKVAAGIFSLIVKPGEEVGSNEMQELEKEARTGKNVNAEFAYGYNLYQFAEYNKEQKRDGLRWLRKAAARGSVDAMDFLTFIGEN